MSTTSLTSVAELLDHIATLPPSAARVATARVDAALGLPAARARLALGVLALDLADPVGRGAGRVAVVHEFASRRASA